MKTTSYNPAKDLRIAVVVAVFALSIFSAVKVKELQTNNVINTDETRSNQVLINESGISSLPVLNARLIEDPAPVVTSFISKAQYRAADFVKAEMALEKQRFLNRKNESVEAVTDLEPRMIVIKYNAATFVEAEMTLESERFLNGISETSEMETALESWMTVNKYNATAFAEAEMNQESERFLNSNLLVSNEFAQTEDAFAIEPWMNLKVYDAKEFVDSEIAIETEIWKTKNTIQTGNPTAEEHEKTNDDQVVLQPSNDNAEASK